MKAGKIIYTINDSLSLMQYGGDFLKKYAELIEFLKEEFLGGHDRLINGDNNSCNRYKNEIERFFDIRIMNMELGSYKFVKMYSILEKGTAKKWDVIVGTVAILFGSNMQKYREQLLEEHSIQGIVTLKNCFFKRAAIPAAIIILNRVENKTWLTSATDTNDLIALISDIKSYKRKVYYTDKLDSMNLMPEFYNDELKKINSELDKYETKTLKEIAAISVGKSVSRDDFGDEGIPYLRARNLHQGKIVNIDTYVKKEEAGKYAKQLLQDGDLLLSKNFGEHRIVQVGIDDIPAIASNGLFIIRAYDVPESYLYQYFSSDTGKKILDKQLESIEKGSTIISINLKDLKELRVPLFDEQTMISLSHVDKLEIPELVSITKKLTSHMGDINRGMRGAELERKIYEDFINVGWNQDDVVVDSKEYTINLGERMNWRADIALTNNGQLLAVVEVKTDFSKTPMEWLEKMFAIVKSGQVPFLILTTGYYYEIHSINNDIVKKTLTVPTKEELLVLLDGKEEK